MKTYLFYNISELVTLDSALKKDGRNLLEADLSIIKDAAIICDQEKILWIGQFTNIPSTFEISKKIDCQNKTIIPEIVDCHTHLVFAGNRAKEYSMRLNGATYEEIAQSGGGIINTMKATNEISLDELKSISIFKINEMIKFGTSVIEIKSGYGLNFDKEKEISLLINDLKKYFSPKIKIKNTFMAAHAIPKTFATSMEYIDQVVIPLLKELAPLKIIDAVDIFHEQNYFSTSDVKKLFTVSESLNIPVKIHADELNDNNGAALACEYQALSCDHLLKINDEGILKLSKSNTVAVILPGTGLFLGKDQAPVQRLLKNGVKLAISSDYNPGSCHFNNVFQLARMMAPTLKMNRAELLSAVTINAASALNENKGSISIGHAPRFLVFSANNLDEILYKWSENLFFKHSFDFIN